MIKPQVGPNGKAIISGRQLFKELKLKEELSFREWVYYLLDNPMFNPSVEDIKLEVSEVLNNWDIFGEDVFKVLGMEGLKVEHKSEPVEECKDCDMCQSCQDYEEGKVYFRDGDMKWNCDRLCHGCLNGDCGYEGLARFITRMGVQQDNGEIFHDATLTDVAKASETTAVKLGKFLEECGFIRKPEGARHYRLAVDGIFHELQNEVQLVVIPKTKTSMKFTKAGVEMIYSLMVKYDFKG